MVLHTTQAGVGIGDGRNRGVCLVGFSGLGCLPGVLKILLDSTVAAVVRTSGGVIQRAVLTPYTLLWCAACKVDKSCAKV